MLERLALAAAFHEFAECVKFGGRKFPLEVQVKFHARKFEHFAKEQFRLQPCGLDAFLCEKFGTFLDHFQHRHVASVGNAALCSNGIDYPERFQLNCSG